MKSESKIKTIFSLNCEQAARLLSENQDVELYWWERTGLRLHLLYCRYCKRYHQQLDLMRQLFRRIFSDDESIPPELKMSDEKRAEMKKIISDKKNFGK
jgi:hypothetical protein